MPKFTISLTDAALAKIQVEYVARYNQNTGENLTVQQWLELHIKDLCIQPELIVEVRRLEEEQKQKQQDDLSTGLRAAQDTLREKY